MLKCKKKISMLLAGIMVFSFGYFEVMAEGDVQIPYYMQPHTVIVYNDDLSYTILEGGEAEEPMPEINVAEPMPANPEWSQEEIEQYNYETNIIDEAKQAIESGSPEVVYEEPFKARSGLKVVYDSEGFIMNVYYPNPNMPSGYSLSDPKFVPAPTTRTLTTIAVWGSFENTLVYDDIDDSVTGTGRFTSFGDAIGDHDNYLQNGDCATKQAYDNIASGTEVHARNLDTNQDYYYIKNDNGGMPDAVLDIWGEGINWIGGNYWNGTNVNNGRMYHKTRAW